MSAVKGSEQYELEVVSYRPVFRWTLRFLLLCLAIGAAAGSYFVGHYEGTKIQEQAILERNELRVELAASKREASEYRQQVANLQLGSEVDRHASEDVRAEVIDLKAQIAGLEEDITFYKGLMSPSANKRGLTIGSLNVLATETPRRYQYKLVLQQLATRHQLLTGYLNVNVVGRQDGVQVTLPLKDLNEQLSQVNIKLRFKYFQNFSGEMQLPEGFEPIRIELLAKSTGKNAVTVEEKFGWLVQNPHLDAASAKNVQTTTGSNLSAVSSDGASLAPVVVPE